MKNGFPGGRKAVGKVAFMKVDSSTKKTNIEIPVKIVDFDSRFGGRYKVEPIGGKGAMWVTAERLSTIGKRNE